MKIGPLEMYWNPGPNKLAAEVRDYLSDSPEVRRGIARIARGEIKDYLTELAEEAEMPFTSPGGLLGYIQASNRLLAKAELERRIFGDDEPGELHIVRGEN